MNWTNITYALYAQPHILLNIIHTIYTDHIMYYYSLPYVNQTRRAANTFDDPAWGRLLDESDFLIWDVLENVITSWFINYKCSTIWIIYK